MSDTLLLELLTEELPPKALKRLGVAFADLFCESLNAQGFLTAQSQHQGFATPRRLAVSVSRVLPSTEDKKERVKILPVSIAFDADGAPTTPLKRKLVSLGLPETVIPNLIKESDGKAETLYYDRMQAGIPLSVGAQVALDKAIAALPIPKVMRYAPKNGYYNDVSFVRPAHRLTALYGKELLPLRALGLEADRVSEGHRFLSRSLTIVFNHAEEYEKRLRDEGCVMASFDQRRQAIVQALNEAAGEDKVIAPDALLDEVTALVESPTIYRGAFDAAFLEVPQECLILTMQQNQKYFALTNREGKLVERFLLVSNIKTDTPQTIIGGNERVLRARLSDARFFYQQDAKTKLVDRVHQLNSIIYFKGLGSQKDRVDRMARIAASLANALHANAQIAARIALLAKADLTTDMVGEFPELQGIMGRYYAHLDGEPNAVSQGIEEHYLPRFSGDKLPTSRESLATALADKLETMVGMFALGQVPTGDKDPFGLRRAAIGILRMLIEHALPLPLSVALKTAQSELASLNLTVTDKKGVSKPVDWKATESSLKHFFYDRLRGLLKDEGATPAMIDALTENAPDDISSIPARLAALRAFVALPEAGALAAANKRIVNILKKAEEGKDDVTLMSAPKPELFSDDAERALDALFREKITPEVHRAMDTQDYTRALTVLASAKEAIDTFFDQVMVMDENQDIRANRLALLRSLSVTMNQVAEISALSL
jgi:glycyl-tRNA synthetase beta chain